MYSKVHKEDPEEVLHQRAKFLIYKTLQEVDLVSRRSSPSSSFLRMKLLRLKVEIGKSLPKLRQSVVSAVSFGVEDVCSVCQLKEHFMALTCH